MKISLEWLSDFLSGPVDAQRAADALTNAGFPVENIETVGSDHVLDVEVTSNRGDCLSHRGVARELGALLDLKISPRLPGAQLAAAGGAAAGGAALACPVQIDAADL